MKNITYVLGTLLLTSFCQYGFSQKNQVAFEQVQIYSSIQPEGKYWHPSNSTIQLFASILDTALFNPLALQRDTSYPTSIKILNRSNQIGKLMIDWSKSNSTPFHAYLELYELQPEQTFSNSMVKMPIPKKDSIQSTWFITCTILNNNKSVLFQKTILMGMIPIANIGIGYPISVPVTTPKNIFKAIQTGIGQFSKTGAELAYIEAKVPLNFATDNFTMPLLHLKPRIAVDTNRGFIRFAQKNIRTLLRVPGAIMNKVDLKDKTSNNPHLSILPEIRKRSNTFFKEYYQAIQPLRNVGENKEYTLEAYIEFNPMIDQASSATPPIRFLPETVHKIYADTILIGNFKVNEEVLNTAWLYNSNEIYNGYDTTTIYKLNSKYPKSAFKIAKAVEGNIGMDNFKILFNDEIDLKIIFLNNVVICALQGKSKPNYILPLNQILENSITPLLVLIAYSEIFQSPN